MTPIDSPVESKLSESANLNFQVSVSVSCFVSLPILGIYCTCCYAFPTKKVCMKHKMFMRILSTFHPLTGFHIHCSISPGRPVQNGARKAATATICDRPTQRSKVRQSHNTHFLMVPVHVANVVHTCLYVH